MPPPPPAPPPPPGPPGGPPAGGPPPGGIPPGGYQPPAGGYPQYAPQPGPVRGHRGGRLGRGILIGVFAGVLVVVLGITAILVTSSAPPPPKSDCPVPPCGPPPKPTPKGSPTGPPLAPALVAGTLFTSPAGYQVEFNPNVWTVTDHDANDVSLELNVNGINAVVQIRSHPISAGSDDAAAVTDESDALGKNVLGLARDKKAADQILEPAVGYRSGAGFAFSGVADTPQGPGNPVAVVVTAAHDDKLLVTFALIADEANKKAAFFLTDSLMNTFRFPSEVNE
jgi:hypothetical protein